MNLKAPFPYFGGKSTVAKLVWSRLGNPQNFIEPFCGSAAVLLLRRGEPHIETVNDVNCYISNFWRATQRDPEAVAEHADSPVNEADLHSRHRWLVLSKESAEFRQRMRTDPDYFDAKIAGWWVWGLSCWIGGNWCHVDNRHAWLYAKRPHLSDIGMGVHTVVNAAANGDCSQRHAWLLDWFSRLRDRLRNVRVCCGDWLRVCGSTSTTTCVGLTGIFLDPPYAMDVARMHEWAARLRSCGDKVISPPLNKSTKNRYGGLYDSDREDVDLLVARVHNYCLERGSDPQIRIALCGYEGEHNTLTQFGWECVEWHAQGGYSRLSGKTNANAKRERIWFSPHCLKPQRSAQLELSLGGPGRGVLVRLKERLANAQVDLSCLPIKKV